jgi:hypothetical protein
MTTKADFTPEEWAILRKGLVAGEEAVRAAAPKGWYGRMKESRALKREWKSILDLYGHMDLARDLVGTEGEVPVEQVKLEEGEAGPFIDASLEACRAAARVISSKGDPRNAEIYADVAMHLAETAAMAHGGSEETQHAEALVLRRVAAAFGRTDYEPGAPTTLTGDTLMNERALQSSQQYE